MSVSALSDKVAFVANGTHGLGAALTDALLTDGVKVAVGYSRKRPEVDEFLELHQGSGISVHEGTLGSWEDCTRALGEATAFHGRLDLLVTVVGSPTTSHPSGAGSLIRLSPHEWQQMLAGSLTGVFNLTAAATEHLHGDGARVVTVLSALPGSNTTTSSYAWVRDGMLGLSRQFARELAPHGVTVNIVETGLFDDESLDVFSGLRDEVAAQVPLGRLGDQDEVVRAVRFLLDPASSYLTGQLLGVDGGIRA